MQTFQIVLFYEFPYSVYVFYVHTVYFDNGRKGTNEIEVTFSSSEKKRLFPHSGPTAPLRFPCLKLCTYLTLSPERLWANELKSRCE